MSGIVDDAHVGHDALTGEGDRLEIVAAGQGKRAGRGPYRAPAGDEIALEAQPIIPSAIATPSDHLEGSVEAIGKQDHGLTRRQPAGDHFEQFLLCGKADGAVGFRNPPGQRQSAPELVEGRPSARSASGSDGDRTPWSGRGSTG